MERIRSADALRSPVQLVALSEDAAKRPRPGVVVVQRFEKSGKTGLVSSPGPGAVRRRRTFQTPPFTPRAAESFSTCSPPTNSIATSSPLAAISLHLSVHLSYCQLPGPSGPGHLNSDELSDENSISTHKQEGVATSSWFSAARRFGCSGCTALSRGPGPR